MDFHTLSRKELQALSKKNKIPANITNVAMADALSALPQVEGLDEILNPKEGGDIGTPSIQIRSASRTTTQRKAVKEPESSKVSTRPIRGTRTRVAEVVVEQENKEANVSATSALVPSSRRRVPAVSTRRKKEVVEDGDDGKNGVQEKSKDVPKTPAVAPSNRKGVTGRSVCKKNETPSGTSVQKGYSTRRFVRLLGKSLSEMSLVDTEDIELGRIDDVSEELSSVSQQVEDSSNTEKGISMQTSLQTVSTVVSENTEGLEVSSLNKADDEGQSHDLGSEEKFVSRKGSDVEAEGQSHDLGSEAKLVSGQEEGSGETINVEAEPIDSSLDLTGNFDECRDSNKAGSELLPELDSGDSAKLENKECNETMQVAIDFEACEEASREVADEKVIPCTEENLDNVADNANHIENVEPMHDDIDESGDSNEAGSELEDSGDSANVVNKECIETEQDAISFEECEEASIEFAVKKDVSSTEEVLENVADGYVNPVEAFEPMHDDIDEAADNKDVSSTEEAPEDVADEYVNHTENFEPCEEASMEIADKKDVSSTEEVLENVADENVNQIENFEPMLGGEQIAEDQKDNKDVLNTEGVIEVHDVVVQLPFLGGEQIAEDQKDISEKLEAEAPDEESQVAAGDDTVIDDGNAFSCVADGTQISFSLQQVESNGISNTLVEADGETKVSSETMTVAQFNEQEIIQSEETKEIQTVTTLMKENLIADFQKMSIRGLKKKLKELDGKPKTMTDNGATCMQEGEKKRTALQALPPNQLKTGEAQNDV